MSLRERIGRMFLPEAITRGELETLMGRAATDPVPFHPFSFERFGPGVGNQPDHVTLLRESMGIPATATRAIANRISELELLVKTSRRHMAGTLEDEILDDHPLKMLLDRPHPSFSRIDMLWLTTYWLVTVGVAYWLKVGGAMTGLPMELHPIPPWLMSTLWRQGVISGYLVCLPDGGEIEFSDDEVVRFARPDPENPWGSEGLLGPSGVAADSHKFAGEHLRSHYQDDATPKTWIETGPDADTMNQSQKERFWGLFRQRFHARFGEQRGVPFLAPRGFKLHEMAMQSGQEVVPLLEYFRDELLMGFNTPRSVLGQVVSGDRSSAETNQWVFDRYGVSPFAALITSALTLQLAVDFEGDVFVDFEEFVSDDKRFLLEQEQSDLDRKVRSVNQVRTDRGLDEVVWGDQPVGKIGDTPYTGEEAENPFAPDNPFALGDGGDDEEPEDGEDEEERKALVPLTRGMELADLEWQRQVEREKRYVPTFAVQVRQVLTRQQRSVLERLEKRLPESRIDVGDLFNLNEWLSLFQRIVEPVRESAFLASALQALSLFGLEEQFVFTEAMREAIDLQGKQLAELTNRTTARRIQRALREGLLAGEGVDEIGTRLRKVFKIRRQEARTIARTEVLKASQTAQIESFKQAGVVPKKRWNTSRDPLVRDNHVAADGQVVAVDDAFVLGNGELAMAPGIGARGRTLSAGNTINCRCFVTPVLD